jgi:iron complex transport system permease protein
VKFVADPANALPDIVFWLLGSLASVSRGQIGEVGPLLAAGIVTLLFCGRFLDVLTLSEDEARSLGVPAPALRVAIIALATITCALTVALAGTIGWVGLVVPHVARLIVGPANRRLLPVAACLGGIFMLVSDTLARSLTASEIPIGIVTDLIGVVAFLIPDRLAAGAPGLGVSVLSALDLGFARDGRAVLTEVSIDVAPVVSRAFWR